MPKSIRFFCLITALVLLTGCMGGAKLIKEPVTPEYLELTRAGDDNLSVSLVGIIVRDSPYAWTANADWDEYILQFENVSGDAIQVTGIQVTDSQGITTASLADRKTLVRLSRQVVKRYEDDNLEVRAGASGGTLAAVGAGTFIIGGAIGAHATASALASIFSAQAASGAAAAGTMGAAAVIAAPFIVGSAFVKAEREHAVGTTLRERSAAMPFALPESGNVQTHHFFPLAPSPQSLEIDYLSPEGPGKLTVDVSKLLDGLHLPTQ